MLHDATLLRAERVFLLQDITQPSLLLVVADSIPQ
jgi:hypothetical protein